MKQRSKNSSLKPSKSVIINKSPQKKVELKKFNAYQISPILQKLYDNKGF